ncbi:methyltransferase [Roseateles sp. LYH14W]|uniref:Methyltransferase n=1 Tax=Pelomonas parva TaxID=3299032 RepID=A0ABW7EWP7_9BURK
MSWGLPRHGLLARLARGPVRRVVSPWLQRRLARAGREAQHWRLGSLRLRIDPGVFPPGPTLSSALFARWLLSADGPGPWPGRRVLDMGCGSGVIGLAVARAGAQVIASDINPAAAANAAFNAQANGLALTVVVADLLAGIHTPALDCILINPPYYARAPRSMPERAWFCGAGFEFFDALFAQLAALDLMRTEVLMVLSEDCDEQGIRQAGLAHGLHLVLRGRGQAWLERNVFMRVVRVAEEVR